MIHENPDGAMYVRMAVWELGDVSVFTTEASGIGLTPGERRRMHADPSS
ncbi:hypothetical protein [Micromonospora craniellae]|nr:hypothetical protein [Micromonospora craniellae]QOC91987.1 hypothetical protein ID554_29640 [Micromonospora craniellae]